MLDLLTLPAALAIGGLGITLFAIARRLMRSDNPPGWLDSDITAYALALLFTAYLALSLMATALALTPFFNGIATAGLASIATHIVLWTIARLIIPVGTAGHGDMPPKTKVA